MALWIGKPCCTCCVAHYGLVQLDLTISGVTNGAESATIFNDTFVLSQSVGEPFLGSTYACMGNGLWCVRTYDSSPMLLWFSYRVVAGEWQYTIRIFNPFTSPAYEHMTYRRNSTTKLDLPIVFTYDDHNAVPSFAKCCDINFGLDCLDPTACDFSGATITVDIA